LIAVSVPVSRASVEQLLVRAPSACDFHPEQRQACSTRAAGVVSGGRTVLVVEHSGRRGSLRLKAQAKDIGEVRFGDGSRSLIPLSDLQPVCWATEE
jgi:ParB family chromosome partitioning protein